jgi:hypothetical protein
LDTHDFRLGELEPRTTYTNTDFTALPIVLAHTEQIRVEAMVMSIIGGLLIYGTIISFTMFFREQEEF